MNDYYYTQRIYEWLTSNQIAQKLTSIVDFLSDISVYVEHIAFYSLVLVLLYVGFKFLRIRSRTL